MKNRLKLIAIIAAVAAVGFSATGCATDPSITRGGWSEYNFYSSDKHVVVGTVVVTNGRRATLLGDMMQQAFAMGAHDIINVRIGATDIFGRVRVATAVAIRYTNELVRVAPPRVETPAIAPPPVETPDVETVFAEN